MLIFLKKNKPFKYLAYKRKTHLSGKTFGLISSRFRGGGFQARYRSIDFYRALWNVYGVILTIEYEPILKKLISLVFYLNGVFSYVLYIKGLVLGSLIFSSYKTKILIGNSLFLKYIPYGTYIHNLEYYPKSGAQYARASGSYIKVLGKFKKFVKVRLKSGLKKLFLQTNFATVGVISDFIHLYKSYFINAGQSRNIGWRPHVRGVAMNAVDHPNGGGKGKKAGKSISMSPWKKLPKGKKVIKI